MKPSCTSPYFRGHRTLQYEINVTTYRDSTHYQILTPEHLSNLCLNFMVGIMDIGHTVEDSL